MDAQLQQQLQQGAPSIDIDALLAQRQQAIIAYSDHLKHLSPTQRTPWLERLQQMHQRNTTLTLQAKQQQQRTHQDWRSLKQGQSIKHYQQ